MILLRALLAAAVLAFGAAPAQAAWHRAETERFIVYGAGTSNFVRDYARRLQTFDWVLRRYHPSTIERPSNTKVRVYVVRNRDGIRQVNPRAGPNVGGFYMASPEGVFATAIGEEGAYRDDIVFHEYVHHFLLENFPVAYPAWFTEGFAEYFMTTHIEPKDIVVGQPNPGRVHQLLNSQWLPLETVLEKTPNEVPKTRRGTFYGQSWLLTHYMRSDPARAAQLDAILLAIAKGERPTAAIQVATGKNLAELTADLRAYRKLLNLTLPNKAGNVEVRMSQMPPSADALLLDELRLMANVLPAQDPAFLEDVRRKAGRFPDDRLAQVTLARAEYRLGDYAAAEAILAKLAAAQPEDHELLVLRGRGNLTAGFREPAERTARHQLARQLLAKAYAQDKTDFRPLYGYIMGRQREPGFPTDNDLNAILEARALAPSVPDLSIRAGVMMLRRGRKAEAEMLLAPLINSPHGGAMAARAKALLQGKTEAQAEREGEQADREDEPEPPGPNPPAPPPPAPKI